MAFSSNSGFVSECAAITDDTTCTGNFKCQLAVPTYKLMNKGVDSCGTPSTLDPATNGVLNVPVDLANCDNKCNNNDDCVEFQYDHSKGTD